MANDGKEEQFQLSVRIADMRHMVLRTLDVHMWLVRFYPIAGAHKI